MFDQLSFSDVRLIGRVVATSVSDDGVLIEVAVRTKNAEVVIIQVTTPTNASSPGDIVRLTGEIQGAGRIRAAAHDIHVVVPRETAVSDEDRPSVNIESSEPSAGKPKAAEVAIAARVGPTLQPKPLLKSPFMRSPLLRTESERQTIAPPAPPAIPAGLKLIPPIAERTPPSSTLPRATLGPSRAPGRSFFMSPRPQSEPSVPMTTTTPAPSATPNVSPTSSPDGHISASVRLPGFPVRQSGLQDLAVSGIDDIEGPGERSAVAPRAPQSASLATRTSSLSHDHSALPPSKLPRPDDIDLQIPW